MKFLSILLTLILTSCSSKPVQTGAPVSLIRYNYHQGEISRATQAEIEKLESNIKNILAIKPEDKTFNNTIAAFDDSFSRFNDETQKLAFLKNVHVDEAIRKESALSEQTSSAYSASVMTRNDLYEAFVIARNNSDLTKLDSSDQKLTAERIMGFKRSGALLPASELEEVKKYKEDLAKSSSAFETNISASIDKLEFTKDELAGVSAAFLKNHQPNAAQKIVLTTRISDSGEVLQKAILEKTRRRMFEAVENRAAKENAPVLAKMLSLRQKIAGKLHYKSWADLRTEKNMIKTPQNAYKFLNDLNLKLRPRNDSDLKTLLEFENSIGISSDRLNLWDIRFLESEYKKRNFGLNDDLIREFFPAEFVVSRMFEIYSQIFGLKFKQVLNADVWAPDVKLYEIRDAKTDTLIAHYYTDFAPRAGKYNWFSALPLVSGRASGENEVHPVAAILGTFQAVSADKPVLLSHSDLRALFHEFGHVMHYTLSHTKYGGLSAANAKSDFVEAPSQMLENWIWDHDILKSLSHHYKTGAPLPDEMITKMVESRDFDKGYLYMERVAKGFYDMDLNSASPPPQDPSALFRSRYKKYVGIARPANSQYALNWLFTVNDYDAAYYGYILADTFADDMFSVFEKSGLLNAEVGGRYRRIILEKGASEDPEDLLKEFLGHAPSSGAFFKRMAK